MLIKERETSFTAAEICVTGSCTASEGPADTMDTSMPEPKGKEKAIDSEQESVVKSDEKELKPIVIDGGCLCSLLRYQINISADFQRTELYQQIVGFAHCYCHSCKCAVSALTRTSLKFPREMVQWTTRAKLMEPQPENSTSASSSRRRRGSGSTSNTTAQISEADKSVSKTTSQNELMGSSSAPKEMPEKVARRANRLQSTLEAVKQDPEFDTEFAGVDNATGCCCYEEDNVDELVTPKSPVWATSKKPSSVMTTWSGNAGYHRRIWKRERGVGGKPASSSEASPARTAPVSPSSSTPKDSSPSLTPRTQTPLLEQLEKGKEQIKPKAKENLWSKMKGKASAAMSSKEKDKAKTTEKPVVSLSSSQVLPSRLDIDTKLDAPQSKPIEAAGSTSTKAEISVGCDIMSLSADPPQPSSLEIFRWETQLLHQQQTDLSHGPCASQSRAEDDDGDPQNNTLPIPWPFKEFAVTTRDGRTSYRGFCSWCGGSLTYRTSATIHGMVDIHAGSMDDPEKALKEIGFLREVHIETAGGMEEGARLGTSVGHRRDGTVDSYDSCDMERRFYFESDGEEGGREEIEDFARHSEEIMTSDQDV